MSSRRKNPHGRHDKPSNARPGARPNRGEAPRQGGRGREGTRDFGRPSSNERGRDARYGAARPANGSRSGPDRARRDPHRDERREPPRAERREAPRAERREPGRPVRRAAEKGGVLHTSLDRPPKAVPKAPRPAIEEPELPLIDEDFAGEDFAESEHADDFAERAQGEDFAPSEDSDDSDESDEAEDFLDNGEHDADFMEEAPELGIGARVVPPNLRYEGEATSSAPPPASPSPTRDVEAQIRALEARLDGLIRRAALTEEAETEAAEETQAISVAPAPFVATTTDTSTRDYVARRWGREALRDRSEEVDDFGLDPSFERKVQPGLELLYKRYFRVQVEGMQHVPRAGRGVIVANHSGALPLDGVMLRTALRLDHPGVRDLRWLAEDFLFYLPFAGVFMNRIGAVRACPENAERLLARDGLVAVFPEGVQGIRKLFRERYQLQRFGRGGYIRLCLRMRAPLVPCAIIGGEETNPLVYRFDRLAEFLKLPYLPVTPTFPWLGPLGLLPAPSRWKIRFGEPLSFDNYGPEAAEDDVLVGRLSERVRGSIQSLLDTGLRERKSVWFG
ncbi:MAG TPA: 1-acyl-sn-glycerol-3-phosphate acyltransferase [Polyangiaceae bacterium]|nr:1-acyl-sn-glycerol-3-phosphate acyltransferase [Polyangiaceae bacterium]